MRVQTNILAGGGAAYAVAHAPACLRAHQPTAPLPPQALSSPRSSPGTGHSDDARLLSLDAARGTTLLMMVSFHGLVVLNLLSRELVTGLLPAWHLARIGFALGTTATLLSAIQSPGEDGVAPQLTVRRAIALGALTALWLLSFQRQAAGIFMFIMGISLALADRRFAARAGGPRPLRAHLVRAAQIAAAALLVSALSLLLTPHMVIRFGILHMLALATLLAAPFLRLPPAAALAGGAAGVAAGMALSGARGLPGPLGMVIGAGRVLTPAADYFPLLPGFGFVLAGIYAGRTVFRGGESDRRFPLPDRPDSPTLRCLAAVGRRSLPIYLFQAPVYLLGLALLGDDAIPLIQEAISFKPL